MELISKEVVKRIIDSGRTREQMLKMVESAVAVEECDDCISREAAISAAKYIFESNSKMKAFCMMKMLEELPSVKPKERTGTLGGSISR